MRPDLSATRRRFLGVASAAGLAPAVLSAQESDKPALLGGAPTRREGFPGWPIIGDNDAAGLMGVLKSGLWNCLNGDRARTFEKTWAERTGSKHALTTANGTSALFTSLNALGVGPGDEVIVPPYTFVATVNAVLLQHALPVFVDTDPETFQIDATKVEAKITPNTRCLIPAHIGGNVADMDAFVAIGKKHNIPVLEDACQAHLAQWRGKHVGTVGTMGCFSFQASKNLNSGEGGAILTQDDDLISECRSFYNNGRSEPGIGSNFRRNGCNLRMTEFQAAILLAQLERLEAQARTRDENAAYLSSMLREIPGIRPAATYEGCTRNAYHLYMFRYDKNAFSGLPRATFLKALAAEGVPCSGGYGKLYDEPFLKNTLESRAYKTVYSAERLKDAIEGTDCPENDRLTQEAVWFTQTTLLAARSSMEQIAQAIRKIQSHAGALAKL